ncbi:MAG: hypothetical protein NTZ85_00095 [Bacteroidia bacterium]|nr:hypothetical protein [Bacteroidia bacterium]
MGNYIYLDIGGTNIRAALFINDEIQPVKQINIKTQSEGQKAEDQILDLIKNIWPQKGIVKAIAVAALGYGMLIQKMVLF